VGKKKWNDFPSIREDDIFILMKRVSLPATSKKQSTFLEVFFTYFSGGGPFLFHGVELRLHPLSQGGRENGLACLRRRYTNLSSGGTKREEKVLLAKRAVHRKEGASSPWESILVHAGEVV